MFKLVIQDDEGKTTVVPLIRDEITIGRKEGNTIRLTERNVSRRHARILRNNGEVQIEDLGSYNGIRVNNARIAERVALRVSDQVQIGDYKLYLKAEGIEQVDDARTMPIERVTGADGAAATESMPAVAVASPTAPVPVQAPPVIGAGTGTNNAITAGTAPTPPASVAQPLVGNANRTLVAMDGSALHNIAAARPIADPALVAKLSETASYGRLVVVSSNFAGKEFELSRPQMIIGRTDENDLVVNHRSISRNHAKVTREPETGRYTISDLQSSNGVRVNGTDYGKVELRRGDVIDLGHVRLRFVEPGEDFLFSRDAEITDVPEAGGKKGLLVAVILGVIVVGAIVVFAVSRGGPNDNDNPGDKGSGSSGSLVSADARGSDVAMVTIDAREPVTDTIDAAAATVGSNGSASLVGSNGSNGSGTHPGSNAPDSAAVADIDRRCGEAQAAGHWSDLVSCANELMQYKPGKAADMLAKAKLENLTNIKMAQLEDALTSGDLDTAYKVLKQIPTASVQRTEAENKYGVARDKAANAARAQMINEARDGKCDKVEQTRSKQPPDVQARIGSVPCTPAGGGSGSAAAGGGACSASVQAAHGAAADTAVKAGNWATALQEYEAMMSCGNGGVLGLAYTAACNGGKFDRAKALFQKLPPSQSTALRQTCLRFGFDPAK